MTLKQIAALGRKLSFFLALFADCFGRRDARRLLLVYVSGQLSNLQRKNAEAIALLFKSAPRTLQRFLESIKWDEEKLRDRCQQLIAKHHAHVDAIGCVDESGTTKSGKETVGARRQWNGNRGKLDNCVVGVHLSYSTPGFQVLLDSTVYLPRDWAEDPAPKKTHVPDEIKFRTKPMIALDQIDRALSNGVRVSAWTYDAFYGHDVKFLDGLESRGQVFVGEIPFNFHGWVQRPKVLRNPKKPQRRGRFKKYPRLARSCPSSEVRNLLIYSPVFREQSWQRYHIKDTDKGPEVWEVKWAIFWRKDQKGLPSRRQCLIVVRNVLSGEVKYYLSNRVPGERNPVTGKPITLRWLLGSAFRRCSIESCFREGKEELGLDHYEVRGWRCVHRHFYLTQLSHLFCARIRQEYDNSPDIREDRISVEQVRSAMNVWLTVADLPAPLRRQRFEDELEKQQYYQRRNKQARVSHTKTRIALLNELGIDIKQIKSCVPNLTESEPTTFETNDLQ